MWETPFDPSMLNKDVIIFCPEKELVKELMELLASHGIKWDFSEHLVNYGKNFWSDKNGKTCYRIFNRRMGYSSRVYYEVTEQFRDYIKCTFYGEPEPEFEPANDNELLAFLGL